MDESTSRPFTADLFAWRMHAAFDAMMTDAARSASFRGRVEFVHWHAPGESCLPWTADAENEDRGCWMLRPTGGPPVRLHPYPR